MGATFYDTTTEEKYCFCTKCAPKLIKPGGGMPGEAKLGVRKAIVKWYKQGLISLSDMDRIEKDSIEVISKKVLGTNNPTIGIWINDTYIIIDELTRKLVIERSIVNFADIDSYTIYDNSIEYNIQAPESAQYNLGTKHGLRRSIVGGMLAGSAGAIMGGLTSSHSLTINKGQKTTYSMTEHNFSILITLKTLAYGGAIVVQIGNDEPKLQLVANLLNKIIGYYA